MSIASEITRLQNAKADIKTAIENKGGTVSGTIDNYATAIDNLPSGGGSYTDYFYESTNKTVSENTGGWKNLIKSIKINTAKQDLTAFVMNCKAENIDLSEFDPTITRTKVAMLFYQCSNVKQLDISKIKIGGLSTNSTDVFYDCSNLETIIGLENQDFSGSKSIGSMFSGCKKLKNIPNINASSSSEIYNTFSGCNALESIGIIDCDNVTAVGTGAFYQCTSLKNVGGLKDLGKAYDTSQPANYSYYTLSFSYSNQLTHDSLMNIINSIYDIASKGVQPQKLILGSINLAKLTSAEIQIATDKGWTVS